MPRDLVGQLRKWQETATGLDEKLNVPVKVDPKVVAAREEALRVARKKAGKGKWSRSQQRKQDFLVREAGKHRAANMQKFRQLSPQQREDYIIKALGPSWAKLFGYGR